MSLQADSQNCKKESISCEEQDQVYHMKKKIYPTSLLPSKMIEIIKLDAFSKNLDWTDILGFPPYDIRKELGKIKSF